MTKREQVPSYGIVKGTAAELFVLRHREALRVLESRMNRDIWDEACQVAWDLVKMDGKWEAEPADFGPHDES